MGVTMGVTSGCGCKGYIDFLILSIYPYSSCMFLFAAASLPFVHFLNVFRYAFIIYCNARKKCENNIVRFEQNCSFAYCV